MSEENENVGILNRKAEQSEAVSTTYSFRPASIELSGWREEGNCQPYKVDRDLGDGRNSIPTSPIHTCTQISGDQEETCF
jgi:hypothetical protein